jgi:hypothetical protein
MLHERGRETLPFEAALDAEPERLRDRSMWSRYGYATKGRYAEQLEDLFERQGRENVLVLIFERDVVGRPQETFERVCAFVGADPHPEGMDPSVVGSTVNAALTLRSVRVRQASQRLPKRARDLVGRWNAKPQQNDPIPAALRQRLREQLAAPTADLERLLGTELVEWRGPARA